MFARVIGAALVDVRHAPPLAERRLDTGQWVCPPDGVWPPDLAAACGWLPVDTPPAPATGPGQVAESTIDLVDGTPTRVWTVRDRTPAEQAAHDRAQAVVEFDRAVAVTAAPAELATVQALTLTADGVADGDPWRQPVGAHDAYPVDATVTHNGKTWTNLTPANVWEPGVSGWRENAACPEWVQPTGAHDAYNTGDCVTYQGQTYVSLIDANTWAPDVYPAGWELQ